MSRDRFDAAIARAPLSARRAHGAVCAALVASGRPRLLSRRLSAARDARVPHWVLAEGILQSYLFAGFPRVLQALEILGRIDPGSGPRRETADLSRALEGGSLPLSWWRRGERTCRRVYGPSYERLRGNIARLHPELADWMISEGYGKVLGRPFLSLAERECWVLPILVVQRADRQLDAHIRGALRAGLDRRDVRSVLALAGLVAPRAAERARRHPALRPNTPL